MMLPFKRSILTLSVASVMLFNACAEGEAKKKHEPADLTKLPPPAEQADVTFAKDIHPILAETCFKCHGEEKQRGGLRVDTLAGVLKGSKEGAIVVPGKSIESKLVIAVSYLDSHLAMPPRRKAKPGEPEPKQTPPLTADQVSLIRAWIDQGAK